MLLEEINDILGLELVSDSFDTIGGWLYSKIEIPPKVDEKIQFNGDEYIVEEVDNVRITRVLISINDEKNSEIAE